MHGISARTLRCYSLKDACALVCRGLRKQARRHKNAKHAINEVVRERDVGTWEQIPHVNLVGSMGRRDLYGNSRLMCFSLHGELGQMSQLLSSTRGKNTCLRKQRILLGTRSIYVSRGAIGESVLREISPSPSPPMGPRHPPLTVYGAVKFTMS